MGFGVYNVHLVDARVGQQQRADVRAALVADFVALQVEPAEAGVVAERLGKLPRAIVVDLRVRVSSRECDGFRV